MATSSGAKKQGGAAGCIACGARSPSLPKKIERNILDELIAETALKEKEVKALYARFRKIAPSGYLNPEQFRATMGAIGLSGDAFLPNRMFQVFDTNNDGKLSFKEFATSLAVMIRGEEADKLKLSFQMASGSHEGIELDDFRQLVKACANTMSSLVAPPDTLSSDEDIDRLFNDLSSDEGDAQGKPRMISMKNFQEAAQTNEEFLQCLGLENRNKMGSGGTTTDRRLLRSVTAVSGASREGPGVNRKDSRWMTDKIESIGPASPASRLGPGDVIVTQTQLQEIRDRLVHLRQAFENVDIVPKGQSKSTAEPTVTAVQQVQQVRESLTEDDPSQRCWPLCKWSQSTSVCESDEGHSGGSPETVLTQMEKPLHDTADQPVVPANKLANRTTPESLPIEDSVEQMRLRNLGAVADMALRAGAPAVDEGESRMGTKQRARVDEMEQSKLKSSTAALDELAMEFDRILTLLGEAQPSCLSTKYDSGSEADSDTLRLSNSDRADEQDKIDMSHNTGYTRELRQKGFAKKHSNLVPTKRQRKRHRLLGPKKGLAVHFGHENWNMVLSMMIGIRMSVARSAHEQARAIQAADFQMKEKFSIIPHVANMFDTTVGKRIEMTRFMDYAPVVFQRIRTSFGITHDEYTRSIGPEQLLGNLVLGNLASLSELSSEGKSGAFFYYTADGKFLIKTVAPKEHRLLKGMLKRYYEHITDNTNTLVVRFFGLHSLRVWKQGKYVGTQRATSKIYFVVMANMFNTPFEIHRRYDLKGSWVGRGTKAEDAKDPTVALKDQDFKDRGEMFRIGPERRTKMLTQIQKDGAFMAELNIIDYSLLVGVHDIEDKDGDEELWERVTGGVDSNESLPIHQREMGGMLSSDKKSLYFFGIIDILTPYDTFKRVEHCVKSMRYDWRGVSCCPPPYYAERFSKFLVGAFDPN